jgi:anaerobic selenocysteine-containing dehydrogenase
MRDGRAKVFVGFAGNFVRATPDSDLTEQAMRNCRLTAHVSTKLNRSHAVCGETALILPTLGRTDRDVQATGQQFVTVEDSPTVRHGGGLDEHRPPVARTPQPTLGAVAE